MCIEILAGISLHAIYNDSNNMFAVAVEYLLRVGHCRGSFRRLRAAEVKRLAAFLKCSAECYFPIGGGGVARARSL